MIEVTPKEKPIVGKVSEMNNPQPQPERKRPRKGKRNLKNRRQKNHTEVHVSAGFIFAAVAGFASILRDAIKDDSPSFEDPLK